MKSFGERVREWVADQVPASSAVLAAGISAIAVVLGGSLFLAVAGGLTPYERVLETIQSPVQGAILSLGLVLGAVAGAAGFTIYRFMPTKASREAAISGAALGLQAVLLSGVYLWFRGGEKVDIFVRQFLRFELLGEFFGALVIGAKNTVILAAGGELLGVVLGLGFALLLLSRRIVVRAPARTYVNFFRGTPLLWQISFGYLGVILGLGLDVSPFQFGIVILGLNAGAYTAEIFRAGIQSIERGQIEAARSLGMSYLQAMRYVILPQAFRRVIPPLTNEFVILIKDTALIAILGSTEATRELLQVGRDAYSERFNATPFLGSAAGYLVITLPLIRAVGALERRLRSGLAGIVGM